MSQPKVEVLVAGKPVEHSLRVFKNGGANIHLEAGALDAKTSKTTAKATETAKVVDGVRFDGTDAIIRISGKDVATIARPKVPKSQKPMKQWKTAINSNLWNDQGGKDDAKVWAYRVTYGDMPK